MQKKRKAESMYTPSERLLLLYEYFRRNANSEKGVTMNMLLAYLLDCGIYISHKMVYRDIEKLNAVFKTEIEWDAAKKVYLMKNPLFEPYELRLMVDSIQAAKFVTQTEAQKICKKICEVTDRHTASELNRQCYVLNRVRSKNDNVVKELDNLYFCINNGCQVSFNYFHYTPSKERKYSKGGKAYKVSPYAILWNDGNCYLYAYSSDKKGFAHFRVDRMDGIKICPEDREGLAEYRKKDLSGRQSKVFNMFAGEEEGVWLLCANYPMADVIIDRFGKDLTLMPVDKEHFRVRVSVEVSKQFYAWLCSFGKSVKVIKPQSVVDGMREYVSSIAEMYEDEGEK